MLNVGHALHHAPKLNSLLSYQFLLIESWNCLVVLLFLISDMSLSSYLWRPKAEWRNGEIPLQSSSLRAGVADGHPAWRPWAIPGAWWSDERSRVPL